MYSKIKETNKLYRNLGSNTRFFIRISLILLFSLIICAIIAHLSPRIYENYDLLFLPDQLLESAKSVLGIGGIGSCILLGTEK